MTKDIVNAVKKHPSLVITLGAVILVAEVFNRFVPIMTMIVGIVNMTGGDILDSILAALHLLIDLNNLPLVLGAVAVIALLFSVFIGLLLPGYLLTAIDGLDEGPGKKGLYREGIRKYFLRFFHMTLRVVLLAFLLLVILLVSTVPGIVMTRVALTTSPELMVAAVFVDVVTVGVVFASLLFFSVYTYMWYIASLVTAKRPFRLGKQVADNRFWNITLGLLIFDVILVVGFFIIFMIGNQAIKYAVGWIFLTAFFTTLALYLVKFFKNNFNCG